MVDVRLWQLSKDYWHGRQCVPAVSEFTLDVAAGEVVSLMGPSGCGKTTLLRLVAGLECPTRGSVSIGGRCFASRTVASRRCGMVFQQDALYPHLTVAENIGFGLKARGVEKEERFSRIRDVAELLGVQDLLSRPPATLSGGQRKRVALGRALASRPDVVLLDEPLSYLDAGQRVAIRHELRSALERCNSTALYVTHDAEEAMAVGDRLAVMLGGTLLQVGVPEAVYENPACLAVAELLTQPVLNVWTGDILRSGDAMILRTVDGDFPLPVDAVSVVRDGRAVMGVRCDALSVGESTERGGSRPVLTVRTSSVERLGYFWDVHGVTAGGRRVVARTGRNANVRPGELGKWMLDHSRTLYFESGTAGANMRCDGNKAVN